MMQCRWWWRDLFRRCPICLEGLRLPLAEGTADRVLLSPIPPNLSVFTVRRAARKLLAAFIPAPGLSLGAVNQWVEQCS